ESPSQHLLFRRAVRPVPLQRDFASYRNLTRERAQASPSSSRRSRNRLTVTSSPALATGVPGGMTARPLARDTVASRWEAAPPVGRARHAPDVPVTSTRA